MGAYKFNMVFEIKKFKLELAGREEPITLSLDFKALRKISQLYGNAYLVISNFLGGDMAAVIPLIRCCADVELTEEEIEAGIPLNYTTMNAINQIFNDLIGEELIGEIEEVAEKN
jgi:hypothetical protein